MMIRGLTSVVMVVLALLLSACGGGSGRGGTDVMVTAVGPTGELEGGSEAVFVMTVTNLGGAAAETVNIVNSIGNQQSLLSITCAAQGAATCPATPTVAMTIASLPSGGSLVFTVTTQLAASAKGTLSNSMSANFSSDIDRGNNSATATLSAFSLVSNLVVGGTGPAGTATGGGSVVFEMTVRNDGPDVATGVHLVDNVGGFLIVGSVGCAASGGATCPATTGVVMDVESLPVGGVLTFTVTTTVANGVTGTVTNTLQATADHDSDRTDNTFTATAEVVTNPAPVTNVSVTGTGPAGPLAGGASGSFVLTVANSGPDAATDVQITNALTDGLSASGTITCAPLSGALCPPTLGSSMVASSIPAGGSLKFTVPFVVNAGASGSVGNTMTVVAAGDEAITDNRSTLSFQAVSTDVGVSQSGSSEVAAGSNAVFTARVANPGPGAATNLTLKHVLKGVAGTDTATITCAPVAGATCPTELGSQMTLDSLGSGRSLVFTITVPVPSSARGNVVSTFSITADGDPSTANNSAKFTTVAVDARNGSYRAYAANGRQYDLSIDFDALKYTMTGNGEAVKRSFTADASGGGYTVSGASRLRTARDLVVGGHDFGNGVLPYLAARKFTTNLAGIAGSYNLATRKVPDSAAATTHAGTAQVSGNTLSVCQSDTAQVTTVRNCAAASRTDYANLSANGDVFVGTTASGASFSFSVANSGAAKIMVSATQAADGSQQLRIGLIDSTAGLTFGPSVSGPSTEADWMTATLVNGFPVEYTAAGSSTDDSASLVSISGSGGGPFSMLTGTSVYFNANIYVLQASPLLVVVGGAAGFGGAASGFLQLGVP